MDQESMVQKIAHQETLSQETAHQQVLHFWFEEIEGSSWWIKEPTFDLEIKKRFGNLHKQANLNELFSWRNTAQSSLAEIIILDQFSRNIYRDKPQSFSSDPLALALAQQAIAKGFDNELPVRQRNFLYLPYMHSESLLIHEEAIKLYARSADAKTIEFENKHKIIIEKFGRYPHRNKILGRQSTVEEVEFLKQSGSGF